MIKHRRTILLCRSIVFDLSEVWVARLVIKAERLTFRDALHTQTSRHRVLCACRLLLIPRIVCVSDVWQ